MFARNPAGLSRGCGSLHAEHRPWPALRLPLHGGFESIAAITRELDETKRKYDALAAEEQPLHDKIQQDHIDQIKELLTPQQRIAYENWRAALGWDFCSTIFQCANLD